MTNLYRFNHEYSHFAVLSIMFIQIQIGLQYSFRFSLTSKLTILYTE